MQSLRSLAPAALVLAACSGGAPPDEAPPEIEVLEPPRGAITSDRVAHVRGEVRDASGVVAVQVAGVEADIEGDAFAAEVPLEPGANRIPITAVDTAGNERSELRAVMAGPFAPMGPLEDAARVAADPELLERIAVAAESAVEELDGEALAERVNPILEIDSLGLALDLADASIGGVDLTLAPGLGELSADGRLEEIRADLRVTYDSGGFVEEQSFTITAGALAFDAIFGVAGDLTVEAEALDFAFEELDLGLEELPDAVADVLTRSAEVQLAETLAGELRRRLTPGLEALSGVGQRSVDLLGHELVLDVRAEEAWVTPDGLRVEITSNVTAAGASTSGYVATPSPPPDLGGSALAVAVSDDAVSQALGSLWAVGAFDRSIDLEAEAGADLGAGIADRLDLELMLPAAVESDRGTVSIEVNELIVTLARDDGGSSGKLAVSATLDVRPTIADGRLTLDLEPPDLRLQLIESEHFLTREDVATLEPILADFLADGLSGVAEGLALPRVGDSSLDLALAQTRGYIDIRGDLSR